MKAYVDQDYLLVVAPTRTALVAQRTVNYLSTPERYVV